MEELFRQGQRQRGCQFQTGGVRLFSLLQLTLLTLMLLPARMAAQTDYDPSVKLTLIEGYSHYDPFDDEGFDKLFDGNKTTKLRTDFYYYDKVYVIFEASKAGIPVGYTITTGNDNEKNNGRNPKSWNLYGNNEGKDGTWTLIQSVTDDQVLEDKYCTSYDFTCNNSKRSYKYYKWEITATKGSYILQAAEFELKLNTCTHQKEDGTSALSLKSTTPATCIKYGYKTYECSICNSEIEEVEQVYGPHTLTKTDAVSATCTTKGHKEYWTCSVCKNYYGDEAATRQINSLSDIEEPATGHKHNPDGTCTVCHEVDYRFSAIAMDGITIRDIIDYKEEKLEVLDLNDEAVKKLNIPENSKGLMFGKDKEASSCKISLHSDKPFVLSFKCTFSPKADEDGDNLSVTGADNSYVACHPTDEEEIGIRINAGDQTIMLNCYKSPKNIICIYDFKANFTYSGAVVIVDESNKTAILKSAAGEEVNDNMYVLNKNRNLNSPNYSKITGSTHVVIDESFKSYQPTTLSYFFNDMSELTKIEGLGNINTSLVKNMLRMFNNCKKLKEVDTEKLNTENVENMQYMFYNCTSLTALDISGFNTTNVKNVSYMFRNCTALERIIVPDIERIRVISGGILTNCPATIYCSPKEASKSKERWESIFNQYYNENNDRMVPYVRINPNAEYGTLCVPFGCTTLEEGSFSGFDKLYTIDTYDTQNSVIKLKEATSIEPGVAYIYHRNLTDADPVANAITFKADLSDDKIVKVPSTDHLLKGTFEDTTAPTGTYVLQTDGMFHPVGSKTIKVGAYRAYLQIPGFDNTGDIEAKNFQMVFEDNETTGVKGIYDHVGNNAPAVYFDLMGRKVYSPAKGQIYIVNGKKVIF